MKELAVLFSRVDTSLVSKCFYHNLGSALEALGMVDV